jgi:alpha-beta hydrolase superfamily lysophospholipase
MINIVLSVFGILFVLVLAASWLLSRVVSDPGRKTEEQTFASESEKGYIDTEWWDSLHREEFSFESRYGYRLYCIRVFTKTPAFARDGKRLPRVMVLCHGYHFNLVGSIKYLDYFLKRGYDAVLYDHRNCGRSGGKKTTMGFFEKDDLDDIIAQTKGRYPPDVRTGTLGESMGGATVLLQCVMKNPPDFVVADCAFSDLRAQLAWRLKVEFHLPPFPFLSLASLFTKLRAGYFFGQVSPLRVIAENGGFPQLPVLFMHGGSDGYILNEMSKQMFEAKKGIRGFHIIPGAEHAVSIATDRALYLKALDVCMDEVERSWQTES